MVKATTMKLTCTECGREFEGADTGPGGVKARLSRHLKAHERKANKDADAPPQTAEPPSIQRVIVDSVKSIQSPVAGPPTTDELKRALGKTVHGASVLAAIAQVETDPGPLTQEREDAIIDMLSLTPADAQTVVAPIAKIFHKTSLNAKYGRTVVENIDVLDSVAILFTMMRHWKTYRNERQQRAQALNPPEPQQLSPVVALAPERQGVDPVAISGKVLSYSDLHPDTREGMQ